MSRRVIAQLGADAVLPVVSGAIIYFCNGNAVEIFFGLLGGYATTLLQDIRRK